MVGTLGQGPARRRISRAAAYVGASSATASLAGLVMVWIGLAVPRSHLWMQVYAIVAVGYLCADLGYLRLPLPQTSRQVPATWRYRYRPMTVGALYGALLGPGIGVRIPFPSYMLILISPFFIRSYPAGAAILGAYGLSRGLSALLSAHLGRHHPLLGHGVGWLYRDRLHILVIIMCGLCVGAIIVVAIGGHMVGQ